MVADIKKAYLQISIHPEDRDVLRFLWVAHLPTELESFPPIVHWQATRVPFVAKPSPFLLAATLHHHPCFESSSGRTDYHWKMVAIYIQ